MSHQVSSPSLSSSSLVVREEGPLSGKKRKGEPLDREEGPKTQKTGELSTPSSSSKVAAFDLEAAKIEGLEKITAWAASFFPLLWKVDPRRAVVSTNITNFKAALSKASDLSSLEKALTKECTLLQKGLAIFCGRYDTKPREQLHAALTLIETQLSNVQKALAQPEPEPLASESAAADPE